jgi:hypothetical protein
MGRSRRGVLLLIASLSLAYLSGCSARIPVQGLDFSPEEKVALTFDDSSVLTGRVDTGETVLYRTGDRLLKGAVGNVDEAEIVISDLVVLADLRSNKFERERMRSYRLYIGEENDETLVLSRGRILQVERVVTDKPRTLRRVIFWGFAAGVGLLAVSDRNF